MTALYELDERGKLVNLSKPTPVTNRLFVYGIFLGQRTRDRYGMSNPEYATIPGYITVGEHIVQAVKVDAPGIALTGLTVDIDPEYWSRIDALEGGYDRRLVETDSGEEVYMYVAPEREDEL